jgi:peptidoglycan/LPS O-acetylase OafA/YrhL
MVSLLKDKRQGSSYRPEIDGLRALAVVAVILNHINKDLLPSGYLGVDIFFVISGYVITSSLLRKDARNLADFLVGFYVRRIKRLIPALVFFVVLTSVLISLVNAEPRVSLGIGWRSLFGMSNIQLYKDATDYFAEGTELNPFIHTWSLAVEEQFYLLFPLLVWFSGFGRQTKNGPRNLFLVVGILSLASLISFAYLYPKNQAAAYFLMPPRVWEMAVGCLVFLALYRHAGLASFLKRIPSIWILFLVVAVLFMPNSIPVPTTFAVVLLSMLLIGGLQEGSIVYRLLTLKKVLTVGLISYSLYLWHWAVLALARWTIGIHW